jgi:DNA-binding transcriptional regulator YiaG
MSNSGEYIKHYRFMLGMSQKELANVLGVTVNTLARWERNCLTVRHWRMLNLALAHLCCIKGINK